MPLLRRHPDLLACLAIALACLAVFGCSLGFGFLENWDDGIFVVGNPSLGWSAGNFLRYLLHPFQDLWTPLPMYSLMIDHALAGLSPWCYHLHNLLLHIVAAWCLYAILRRLGCTVPIALAGALLWALNPQKAESVAWISERKDVQCGALAFAAVLAFLHDRQWLCATLSFLAIAAKPAAIALPGVYLVIWWMRGDPLAQWRRYAAPAAAGMLSFLCSWLVTAQTNPGWLEKVLAVPVHNLFWYPLTAVIPFEVNPIYPEVISGDAHFWLVLAGGIAILAIGCLAAWMLGFSHRQIIGMILLIGGNIVPVMGMLHYTNFRYCDRYNYLVSAVVMAAIMPMAQRLQRHLRRPWLVPALGWCACALFAVLSLRYLPNWSHCRHLALYALQAPGTPNRKAVEMAVITALGEQDEKRLAHISRLLDQRPPYCEASGDKGLPFRFFSGASHPGRQNENLKLFIRAHLAMRRHDYGNAYLDYVELTSRAANGRLGLADTFIAVVYSDLALLSELNGDQEKADFYRRERQKMKL